MDKLLTIIIPSYNMEAYLARCLASLVVGDKALLRALDVIVVNDGSNDRTSEIAHAFADHSNADIGDMDSIVFKVIDKSNGNYGSCVNVGLQHARGRFVRVLDADDYFDTAAFERYLSFLATFGVNDESDLVITDHDKVSVDGKVLTSCPYPFAPRTEFGMDAILPHLSSIGMLAMTYRLDLLKSIKYVQTEGISYTDTEFAVVPMLFVKRIVYCPECVYHYFIGREGQTISAIATQRSIKMHVMISRNIADRFRILSSVNDIAKENLSYFNNNMKHHIGFAYSHIVQELPIECFNAGFGAWDAQIKSDYPELYREFGEKSIAYHCVPFLKLLRRLQKMPVAQKIFLAVFRMSYRLRSILAANR